MKIKSTLKSNFTSNFWLLMIGLLGLMLSALGTIFLLSRFQNIFIPSLLTQGEKSKPLEGLKTPQMKKSKQQLLQDKLKGNKVEDELPFDPYKYIEEFDIYNLEEMKQQKRFHHLIGLDKEKAALDDFMQSIRAPSALKDYGFSHLTGVIFHGPPGTGKTTLARAAAAEAGYSYMELDGTLFQKFDQKEAIEMVDALFYFAKKFAPVIVCIDECEIPMHDLKTAENQATKNVVTKFKNQLTGLKFNPESPILFIGTTNHLEEVDEAIKSRFDYKVLVEPFDLKARKIFLTTYADENIAKKDQLGREDKITVTAKEHLNVIAEKLEPYPALQNTRQLISLLKKSGFECD
ncbi:MAG: ATP-dependent zinc metalloprotease FtsH [Candidatus Phytoplasma pruni]